MAVNCAVLCSGRSLRVVFTLSSHFQFSFCLLGAFSPSFNLKNELHFALDDILPSNAHLLANGRLFVSITPAVMTSNRLISYFKSRSDLLDVLETSCFIPGFSEYRSRHVYGFDGGFTNNIPKIPDKTHKTVTISPFCGYFDICPKMQPRRFQLLFKRTYALNLQNLRMIQRAFGFGFPDGDELEYLYQRGMSDAESYFKID